MWSVIELRNRKRLSIDVGVFVSVNIANNSQDISETPNDP